MKKNIFITGVSGYLGTRLTEALLKRKEIGKIVGIDIRPPAKTPDRLVFHRIDIRDPAVGKLMAEHDIDTVIHLAFVVQPIRNRKRMHDIDFNGTKNILDAAREVKAAHVIAISSTLAYGAHPDNPDKLAEDAPLRGNPSFPYGFEKAETDRMIQAFAAEHPEMTVTILRPCTVFGPSIDNYISRMLFLPVTVCVRGCDPPVQFVHERDFVDACLLAMDKRAPGAFNIVGDGTVTVRQIARMLGTRVIAVPPVMLYPALECLWRLHAPKIEVNRGYLDYIRYPFIAANRKAKIDLDFRPRYSSRKTVEATVRSRKRAATETKKSIFQISTAHNGPTVLLLAALFACGLAVSLHAGAVAALTYLLLWGVSYGVIFAGTCRYCAYYGKKCPIPLEGSCVDRLFTKKAGRFGYRQLLWATAAYGLRLLVPVWVILQYRMIGWGIAYAGLLAGFWIIHLRVTGCPNCINTACPLNPDAGR